ncbi:MAG: HAD domain-containing protein [Dermatophilaceae bacterium]
MRPLLLMDVDGPLNPYGAGWFRGRPQHGYVIHELTPAGERTYRVALHPDHGEALRRVGSAYDLVWATTWQHEANRLISPILGLPDDLPVVPLRLPRHHIGRWCWKTDQIAEWVGDRPFAWFDDEINRATRDRLARMPGLGAHLALRIEPHVGLRSPDFASLQSFADGLAG